MDDEPRNKWAALTIVAALLAVFAFLPTVTAMLVVAGATTVYAVIHAGRGTG